jgi:hypothetical protein
MYFYMVSEPL